MTTLTEFFREYLELQVEKSPDEICLTTPLTDADMRHLVFLHNHSEMIVSLLAVAEACEAHVKKGYRLPLSVSMTMDEVQELL